MFNKLVGLLSKKFCIDNGIIENEEVSNLSIIDTAYLWRYYHTIESEDFDSAKMQKFQDIAILFEEGLGTTEFKNENTIFESSSTLFGSYDIEFDYTSLPLAESMEFNLDKLDDNGNTFFKYLNTIIHEFEHRRIAFKHDLKTSYSLSKKRLNAQCEMKEFAPYINSNAYEKMILAIEDIDSLSSHLDVSEFLEVIDYVNEINYTISPNELNSIKVASNEEIYLLNAFLVKLKSDLADNGYSSEKLQKIEEKISIYLESEEQFITQMIPKYFDNKESKNTEFAAFGKTIQKLWIERINSTKNHKEKIEYATQYTETLNISNDVEINDMFLNSDAPLKYKNYAINHELSEVTSKQLYNVISQNFNDYSDRGIRMLDNLLTEFVNINQNLVLYYFVDIAGREYIEKNLSKITENQLRKGLHSNLSQIFEVYKNPDNSDTIHLRTDIEKASKMPISKLKSDMQTFKVDCRESD